MNNLAKKISIVAGIITAITLAYSGLSPIWNLPFATEIQQTGAVFVVLLSGILSAFTGQKIITNKNDQKEAEALIEENTKMAASGVFKGVTSSTELSIKTPNDLAEKHADFEADGGQGSVYSVDVSSYDAFRNNVVNHGYDIDNYYGFQCWDGAALLWQQIGRDLSTGGTGAAKGCWTHARDKNAGSDFDVVTSQNNLRRGDVIVFGGGQYGHIGFVDRINGDGTINVLGQNQNGGVNGSPFNVIRMSLGNFLGAFRFKRWNVEPPVIQQPPQYKPVTAIPQIGDRVTTTATVDQNGVPLNLAIINDGQSYYSEVNSRGYAVLRKGDIVRCAVPVDSLRKV